MGWRERLAALLVAIAVAGLVPGEGLAQGYPNRPIRFIAAFPPGSASEILGRVVGQKLEERWGQPVVVETRPGAGGTIGADVVAKSAPDGYTLLVGSSAEITVGVSLYAKLPYDPVRDLAPVIVIAPVPNIVVINPSVPVTSVKEFVAMARSKPGQINFGSSGNGTTSHLAGEMLKLQAGIDMVHIPYRGSPPALTDLLGGRISVMFAPLTTALPHVKAGKLVALAVSSPRRSSAIPELPTLMESGFPDFEASIWFGLLAPAGTPKDIIAKLNGEVGKILQLPDVRETLGKQGAEPVGGTSEEYGALIKKDIAKWAKVVKESGARID
jgi:tripartite-type tricarboxylate transporter receptor subunit TctC